MAKKASLADAVRKVSRGELKPATRIESAQTVGLEEGRQQNRVGKRNVAGWFDETVHRQLKILAIEEGKTSQQLLTEALNLLFEKYKKNPIA